MKLLVEVLELFLPGSYGRINPIIVIVLSAIISLTVFMAKPVWLLAYTASLLVILSKLRGRKILFKVVKALLVFLTPFMFLSLVFQYIIGLINPVFFLNSSLRIIVLVLLSSTTMAFIDPLHLVSIISRKSHSLAIALTLVFKLAYILYIDYARILEVHSVNLRNTEFIKRLTATLTATTYLALTSTLSFIEYFYTRKHLITRSINYRGMGKEILGSKAKGDSRHTS